MPLYMDIHKGLEGLTPEAVEQAHGRDLAVQERHGVNLRAYWYNEEDGTVFCLAEAPSREAFEAVHREANDMVADEIIQVSEGT